MFRFLKRPSVSPPVSPPVRPAEPLTEQPKLDAQALLARIQWSSAKRLDGMLQGDYRTLFRGAGLMLADLREYGPQDDVRHIDWNVTARMQTPYVRELEEDRELAAWFLIDLSPSVEFGSSPISKRMVVAQLIATLGYLLQRHGNRIGCIIDTGDPQKSLHILPTRNNKQHLLRMLDRVLNGPVAYQPGSTDLDRLLTSAQRLIGARSSVFVISDFLAKPGWSRPLSQVAARHDVVAVRLIDPMEQSLPDMGLMVVRDSETGEKLFIDTQDRGFRERFSQAALTLDQTIRADLSSAGVDCLEVRTDDQVEQALVSFIAMRKQAAWQLHRGRGHA
jgi:uncharacterized protein (DUF58 family)